MLRKLLLTAAIAGVSITSAHAQAFLIAQGTLTGSSAGEGVDLSGLDYTLENGLPANILGGIGSGLSYAGGDTFIAVPDRGPNATPYNSMVDDTVSYVSRFQTLSMSLVASAPGSALPYVLTPTLTQTTLLSSPTALNYGTGAGLGTKIDGTPLGSGAPIINTSNAYYFTGRSDNYGAGDSGNPLNARFDPESVRVSNDGKSVFISDEYGPYVRQFDRSTGQLIHTFELPSDLNVANLSPMGNTEISGNAVGRVANKGMEGLSITPDGKTLVGIMQAPLEQDVNDPATKNMVRIVTIDIASGKTQEFGYQLTTGSGVSDIVAINDHEFLVDERDGKGLGDSSNAKIKQVFQIDIAGAKDITGMTGSDAAAAMVTKASSPFIDLVASLLATGLTKAQIPAKIEGIAFGQDVLIDGNWLHTLYIANDNDFLPGVAGPNQFYVFAFSDADLPGYMAQQFTSGVPEPTSWAMMLGGFGIAGGLIRRRKKAIVLA